MTRRIAHRCCGGRPPAPAADGPQINPESTPDGPPGPRIAPRSPLDPPQTTPLRSAPDRTQHRARIDLRSTPSRSKNDARIDRKSTPTRPRSGADPGPTLNRHEFDAESTPDCPPMDPDRPQLNPTLTLESTPDRPQIFPSSTPDRSQIDPGLAPNRPHLDLGSTPDRHEAPDRPRIWLGVGPREADDGRNYVKSPRSCRKVAETLPRLTKCCPTSSNSAKVRRPRSILVCFRRHLSVLARFRPVCCDIGQIWLELGQFSEVSASSGSISAGLRRNEPRLSRPVLARTGKCPRNGLGVSTCGASVAICCSSQCWLECSRFGANLANSSSTSNTVRRRWPIRNRPMLALTMLDQKLLARGPSSATLNLVVLDQHRSKCW